ncbi:hypothetical protein EYZ11_012174 [Aspergillus tanneri]|uniref:Uncharacterized protein n=1 Tax=Aspergillus tanneri TaxID=1220188 RepID=A0A4S3J0X9_9EURO|nr:hypothetical protein EYZ11_012174 [Aspergillus tanneri]
MLSQVRRELSGPDGANSPRHFSPAARGKLGLSAGGGAGQGLVPARMALGPACAYCWVPKCALFPQGVGYFSDEDRSSMTGCRILKKAGFDVLEAVIQQFRPLLLETVPPKFFEIFLYNRLPASCFAVEEWTERDILSEPLDSKKFDHAFDLMPKQGI